MYAIPVRLFSNKNFYGKIITQPSSLEFCWIEMKRLIATLYILLWQSQYECIHKKKPTTRKPDVLVSALCVVHILFYSFFVNILFKVLRLSAQSSNNNFVFTLNTIDPLEIHANHKSHAQHILLLAIVVTWKVNCYWAASRAHQRCSWYACFGLK